MSGTGTPQGSSLLPDAPGYVERLCFWLPKRIDKVWRKTIKLQRKRYVWRIPYAISRASDYVAFEAMCRLMARYDRARDE